VKGLPKTTYYILANMDECHLRIERMDGNPLNLSRWNSLRSLVKRESSALGLDRKGSGLGKRAEFDILEAL
jgi:hypothetical protein